MFVAIFVFLLPVCSFALFTFGFWAGRCARKLPVIDDGLPWTLSRSYILPPSAAAGRTGAARSAEENSGTEIARICEAAGWIGPAKPPAQASLPGPDSLTDTQAA